MMDKPGRHCCRSMHCSKDGSCGLPHEKPIDTSCTCGMNDTVGGPNGPSPTVYSVIMDMCPVHGDSAYTAFTDPESVSAPGWVAPTDEVAGESYPKSDALEIIGLPSVTVQRGGVRYPRYPRLWLTVSHQGWRKWYLTGTVITGFSEGSRYAIGPFTSRRAAVSMSRYLNATWTSMMATLKEDKA